MTVLTTETGPFTCSCGKAITREESSANGWRDEDRDLWCPDGEPHAPAVEDDPRSNGSSKNGERIMTATDTRKLAERWDALKSDLAARIDSDYATARSFPVGSDIAAAHFSLVSANRTTLAKMQELENSR